MAELTGSEIIAKCLAKVPKERFLSGTELAKRVRSMLHKIEQISL